MNYRDYIILDFETTSKYPTTTQPVQLAAVVVHGRKLEIKPDSEFSSLIKPIFDEEECKKLNLDPLDPGAVAVHGKTEAILADAPNLKSVWSNFCDYVSEHNFHKKSWSAPIMAGYNIRNFDSLIIDRICNEEPWKYGPYDEKFKCQGLFQPIHAIDLLDFMFAMFENDKSVNSLSADNLIRGHFGYAKGEAHDALSDVIMTAELFCRTMKWIRHRSAKTTWRDSMK